MRLAGTLIERDPAGKGVEAVRPICDEIDRRVRDLLTELTADAPVGQGPR
jgi:hypothetical protein